MQTCFRSYLTNMCQYTVVNGVKSDFEYVEYGVPQGSVLGPLFFLLYINDIYRAIGCNAVRLFADDASLIIGNRDLQPAKEKTNEMFTKLHRWCLANKLSMNKDKTNFVVFHDKKKFIPENFDCIETENMPIKKYKWYNIWDESSTKICIGMLMLIMYVCPWLKFSESSIMWNTLYQNG